VNSGLARHLDALDVARADLLTAVHATSPAQRAFRPARDSWSMVDVVEHLVLAEEGALLSLVKGPRPGARVTVRNRITVVLIRLYLSAGFRARVPASRLIPQGGVSLEELERRWAAVAGTLRDRVAGLGHADRHAPRFRHPIAGWLPPASGFAFLVTHLAHHRRQIDRIRRSPGFPSA
jgi:DinB family protein